ncbi:primosomal protein [Leifsonia sp. YIM 134122]|uniref:Primosomal protein n=1 Tax=Leifsonia stereocauli TaxID=3134136 RepID=A0ABU9W6S0_9MICO
MSDYPPRDRAPKRDDDRPARSGSSGGSRGDGDKKPWEKRDGAPRSGGDRKPYDSDRPQRSGAASGDRKPWEKRDGAPSGDRRPYNSERKPYDNDRPQRSGAPSGERKPWEKREGAPSADRRPPRDGDRKPYNSDRKPYGSDRPQRSGAPSGERKPWEKREGAPSGDRRPPRDGDRKPYNSERKPYGSDRPQRSGGASGDRKPWERNDDRGGSKPWEKRDGAPSGDSRTPWAGDRKPPRDGDRKPYSSERKPYSSDRPQRSGEPSGKPWEKRDDRGGSSSGKPWEKKDDRAPKKLWTRDGAPARGDRGAFEAEVELTEEERRAEELRMIRPRHDDPWVPDGVEPDELDRVARNELKTLTKENAEWVAKHLVMAVRLIEDDPELAHQHVISASRRAGRIAVVRETLAITAYAVGDYALALRELRTFRRISGKNDQLPLMVDSERGVGRPDRALELGRSVDRSTLASDVQVALAIAMSGARLDLGQTDEALAELEITQLDPNKAFSYSPGLFAAYADVLEDLGRNEDSAAWRERSERAAAAITARDGGDDDYVEVLEEDLEFDDVEEDVDGEYAEDRAADAAIEADAEAEEEGEELEAELDADFEEALEADEPVTDDPDADEPVADEADAIEPDASVTDAETEK